MIDNTHGTGTQCINGGIGFGLEVISGSQTIIEGWGVHKSEEMWIGIDTTSIIEGNGG